MSRIKNIKKWITTLSLGLVCCCFGCGCAGNVVVPYDDESIDKNDTALKWMGMGIVSLKCLPFCGMCLGCCGEFGPEECL